MIFVRISGGLGNQMFQYAAAYSKAREYDYELVLDNTELISDINLKNTDREFELNYLNINSRTINIQDYQMISVPTSGLLYRLLRKASLYIKIPFLNYIRETSFSFDKIINRTRKYSYIDGNWQSEKYFLNCRDDLRKQFIITDFAHANQKIIEKMKDVESVAIHIRRGDYLTNPNANKVHGVCPISYYKRAIADLREKKTNLQFFVFSDDPQWAKENLAIEKDIIFIDHNTGDRSYLDMQLMINCRNHIIANSSFSWWGAWLSDDINKYVYAPKKWFLVDIDTSDLIPKSWIRI